MSKPSSGSSVFSLSTGFGPAGDGAGAAASYVIVWRQGGSDGDANVLAGLAAGAR
jgi:hypothetical protein